MGKMVWLGSAKGQGMGTTSVSEHSVVVLRQSTCSQLTAWTLHLHPVSPVVQRTNKPLDSVGFVREHRAQQ
jgi:hypothetical protein